MGDLTWVGRNTTILLLLTSFSMLVVGNNSSSHQVMHSSKNETKTSKLSPALIEKARVELNETQSEVPDQIKSLRNKIQEDPCRNFKTDDEFLLRFLRAERFDQDKALDLMIRYYKQRESYPNLFRPNRSQLEKVLSAKMLMPLKGKDSEGRGLIFATVRRWDLNESTAEDLILSYLVCLEMSIQDPANQINGMTWIYDLDGPSVTHAVHITPNLLEVFSVILHHFPVRYKAIHYVNQASLFDGIYAVIKTLVSKETLEIISLHGTDYSSLHEKINPKLLPEEAGGELLSVDYDGWNSQILDFYDNFLQEEAKYGFLNKE